MSLKDYLQIPPDFSIGGIRCDEETYKKFKELRKIYNASVRTLISALINQEYDKLKSL